MPPIFCLFTVHQSFSLPPNTTVLIFNVCPFCFLYKNTISDEFSFIFSFLRWSWFLFRILGTKMSFFVLLLLFFFFFRISPWNRGMERINCLLGEHYVVLGCFRLNQWHLGLCKISPTKIYQFYIVFCRVDESIKIIINWSYLVSLR